MAKLALLFVAAFCLVQIGMGARLEKRDTAETGDQTVTTESFLDTLKNGVKNTFSPENIEKARDALSKLGTKAQEGGQAAIEQLQSGFKKLTSKDDTAATDAPAPAAGR